MVSTGRRLETWLKTKSPEDRRLILARVGFTSEDDVTPQDLARLLLQPRAALSLARLCTRPQHQALSAVAWLAAQRHGPLLNLWHDADPATRAVPRADVLDLLAGSDPALRARAAATLDALADMALVLPPHDDQVIVSTGVHAHLAESGLGRPAAELIRLHFNAPEVHAIAETLGFPKARAREGAERNVLGLLADQERVRTLLAQAPAEAREWLLDIIGHGSQVLTHAYQARGGFGYQQAPKYAFRPGGSGDPNTDWLAARGLLLPAGPYDTAEVPIEVAVAALGELRVPFVPEPPRPRPVCPTPPGPTAPARRPPPPRCPRSSACSPRVPTSLPSCARPAVWRSATPSGSRKRQAWPTTSPGSGSTWPCRPDCSASTPSRCSGRRGIAASCLSRS
ncbi:hypothetical protein GCM10027612_05190 [Microbispora bryophytorum subsp. camponoti]